MLAESPKPAPTPGSRPVVRFVRRWAIFLFSLWIFGVIVMKFLEHKIIFQPSRADELWKEPKDPRMEDVSFLTSDGTKIHGWFLASDRTDREAVLFSHGNGENLSTWASRIVELGRVWKRPVLIYDYPGYGKSEGTPSESGCYAAGDAAMNWLESEKKFPSRRVILFGESLGGGVSTELAVRRECAGLVLKNTFSSMPRLAKEKHPWLPCYTLMSVRFENDAKIARCRCPVFIVHGADDELIPVEHSRRLFDAAEEPKKLMITPGGHAFSLTDAQLGEIEQFIERK